MNKKGFIIIFNRWYFIIIGLIFLFVILQDTWESYDVNVNFDALKFNNKNDNEITTEDYNQIYLNEIKQNLSVLNTKYYSMKCNGSVSKDVYEQCNNLYLEISELTDIHNSIINGSYIPIKPKQTEIVEDQIEEEFISITKIKNSSIFDDTPTSRNYDSYSKESDTSLFTKSYPYEFEGKKYNIELELSNNKYKTYSSYEREYTYYGSLPSNWETSYYKMFVNEGNDDELINEIISEIRNNPKIATDEDELKAVISFVQSIPYDYDSYYNINDNINYPYETVYENTGVCSDVSVLLIKLIQELGYEVVGFVFENANHMAVGIKCPSGYGNFGTNYCFIEATDVTTIGYVPNNYGIYGGVTLDKNPLVIKFNTGKTYERIIEDKEEQEDLIDVYGEDYLSMNSEQQSLTEKMTLLKDKIDEFEDEYDDKCSGTIYIGTTKERTCDKLYNELDGYITDYNDFVEEYNNLVE